MKKYDIKNILQKFYFVNWDRFVDGKNTITFYGWIDRKQDSYKDFMIIEFWKDDSKPWWITSSPLPEHDEKIYEILDEDENTSTKCQRVEDNYNIINSIKLKK